jgi:hypothetical protein
MTLRPGHPAVVEWARQSMWYQQDSNGHARPARVQHRTVQHAPGHERWKSERQLTRTRVWNQSATRGGGRSTGSGGLRVVLPKRAYAMSLAQFLYAEGAPDNVRAVFHHARRPRDWCGLDALLPDVAAQVVTVLRQPLRSEYFAPAPGPRVVAVEVLRMEGSVPS